MPGTLSQQQKAGGTIAAVAAASIDLCVLFGDHYRVCFLGFAVGAAPSPDGLVLFDPTSSCLAYGAFVALRSTAFSRPCVVRLFIC